MIVTGGHVAYPTASTLSSTAGAAAAAAAPATSATCERALVVVRILGFHRVWQGTGKVR